MSRAFLTVLGRCHPVPVGDDHRFGLESHVFGLIIEQGREVDDSNDAPAL